MIDSAAWSGIPSLSCDLDPSSPVSSWQSASDSIVDCGEDVVGEGVATCC
jgi:hypothetical protein